MKTEYDWIVSGIYKVWSVLEIKIWSPYAKVTLALIKLLGDIAKVSFYTNVWST